MNHMSYKQFLDFVREQSIYELDEPSEYHASINHIVKNNAVELDGLCLRRDGESIAPAIYLNEYYEQYLKGRSMKEILDEIVNTVYIDTPRLNVPAAALESLDAVKDHIYYRLVNLERNKKQLKNCPYLPFCDLAITFRWLAHADHFGVASSLISNRELEAWGISVSKLYEIAVENTAKLFPYNIQPIENMIRDYYEEIFDDPKKAQEALTPVSLYILTNQHQISGATCMIYSHVLENFAKEKKADIYILPSSIHEVLLLPDTGDYDEFDLLKLVHDANSTVVEQTDFLSNNIYFYSRKEKRITLIVKE